MDFMALFAGINYLAVGAGMVASIVVGSIWYSPAGFFNIWWKGIGKGDATPGSGNMVLIFGLTFVASYIKILGLALVIALVAPGFGGFTVVNGLIIALGVGLLFIFPTYLTNNLFAGYGPRVYFIMVGNHLLDFLIASVILVLWR